MSCISGKVRYRNMVAAQLAVVRLGMKRANGNERRQENRAYRCPRCGGCHVTSHAEIHHGRS